MKLWTRLLILTLIDFILIWYAVRRIDPDPSVSIELMVFIPALIIINLLVAFIFLFIKKEYVKLFLLNTVISSVVMYFIFIAGINRHQRQRYEDWTFKIDDKTYRITHSILDTTFSITYSTNPGSATGFLNGKFIENKNEIYLHSDTMKYTMRNGYLFGFTENGDSIKLEKLER
jgi:hypothetical protein